MKDQEFTKVLSERSTTLSIELKNLKVQKTRARELVKELSSDIRKKEKDLKAIQQLLNKGEPNVRVRGSENPVGGGAPKAP